MPGFLASIAGEPGHYLRMPPDRASRCVRPGRSTEAATTTVNSARPRRHHTSCHPGRHSRFTSRPHITTDDALMQTAPEPVICVQRHEGGRTVSDNLTQTTPLRSAKCPRESAKRGVRARSTEQCFRRSTAICPGQPNVETESG